MKTYTLEELKAITKDQGYRHVRLTDSDGNMIVAFNPASITVGARIDEMATRLKGPAMKDGYYIFEGKQYLRTEAKVDKYPVLKGTAKEEINLNPEPEPIKEDHPLTYDQAIKMNKQIAELKAQNEYLERERDEWKLKYDQLMEEVEEIIAEEPEEDETMSEGNGEISSDMQKFWTQLSENLLPVIDRHYDMKEKKLQIEEGKVIADLAKQGIEVLPQNGEETPEEEEEYEEVPGEDETEEAEVVDVDEMGEGQFNTYVSNRLLKLAQEDEPRYREVVAAANAGGDIVDLLNGGTGFDVDPEDVGEAEPEEEEGPLE